MSQGDNMELGDILMNALNIITMPTVLIVLSIIYANLKRVEERVENIDRRLSRIEGKMEVMGNHDKAAH